MNACSCLSTSGEISQSPNMDFAATAVLLFRCLTCTYHRAIDVTMQWAIVEESFAKGLGEVVELLWPS